MDFKNMIDLHELTEEEFNSHINKLSKDDLDSLLFEAIDTLFGSKKVELLLKNGAEPNQLAKDGTILWTIAFARDAITLETDNDTVTDVLIPYVYNVFSEDFKEKCKNELVNSLKNYDSINKKSNIYYNNLGHETKKGQEFLDKEHNRILNEFVDKIENIYKSTKKPKIKQY